MVNAVHVTLDKTIFSLVHWNKTFYVNEQQIKNDSLLRFTISSNRFPKKKLYLTLF